MRHERSAHASSVEQMFFEGKRNHDRVSRVDKDGRVTEWIYLGKAVLKDGMAIVDEGPGTKKTAFKTDGLSLEGNIEFADGDNNK